MDSTVSIAGILKAVAGLLAAVGLAGGVALHMSGDDGGGNKNVSSVASRPSGDVSCLAAPKEGIAPGSEQKLPQARTVANTVLPSTAPKPQSIDGNCPQPVTNPAPAVDPVAKGLPLWELISNAPSKEGRLYTTSNDEFKSAVEVNKLTPEPAAVALVSPTGFEGATPIYRLRNDQLNTWIYTIDTSKGGEKEKLLAGTQAGPGWKEEGVTGYISPQPKPGLDKFYRLHKNGVNEWRFALGEAKANEIVAKGYTIDGDPKDPQNPLKYPMGYAAPTDVKPPAVTAPAAPAPPAPQGKPAPQMSAAQKHCEDAGKTRFRWDAKAKKCRRIGPAPAATTQPPAPEVNTYYCGTSLSECKTTRGEYARYYKDIGDIQTSPCQHGVDQPGKDCPNYKFTYGAHK